MGMRHSEYPRSASDFYVEPSWAVHGLFSYARPFLHAEVHDCCAGSGTVVNVATARGLVATGADIVDRSAGRFEVVDFFRDSRVYANLVTNPPYSEAARLVAKALDSNLICGGRIAVLVPVTFLCSAKRHRLFARGELDQLLLLSRRPSMPPGELLASQGESCRHSGSTDFCWCVWQRGRGHVPPTVTWIPPNG